jgi:hypothetical protein
MTFLGVCKLKCCITIALVYVLYSYGLEMYQLTNSAHLGKPLVDLIQNIWK